MNYCCNKATPEQVKQVTMSLIYFKDERVTSSAPASAPPQVNVSLIM